MPMPNPDDFAQLQDVCVTVLLPPPRRLCFHRCLFVSRIMQN